MNKIHCLKFSYRSRKTFFLKFLIVTIYYNYLTLKLNEKNLIFQISFYTYKKIINPLLVVSYTYILTHLTFLRNTVIMIIIKILLRK